MSKGAISDKVSQKWKRWWCILLKNSILFLKKPGVFFCTSLLIIKDIEPVAVLSLEGADININTKSKDKKFVIELLTKEDASNYILTDLAFFSEREMTVWSKSIQKLLSQKGKEEVKISN